MVEESSDDFLSQGQHFDPGPINLDLYHLLCLILADRQVAKIACESKSIEFLQDSYLRTEIRRILISSAAALRIKFDLHGSDEFKRQRAKDCGKLFPDWTRDKKKAKVLTLHEACNKIIHTTTINYDSVIPNRSKNPDQEGVYLLPFLYLYRKKGEKDWRAKLSIVDFVQGCTSVLRAS